MWVSITPADIAQVKRQLAARHAAILARHADELRSLEADAAQLDELAGRVAGFIAKFKASAPAPAPPILAARAREPRGYRPAAALVVAGFDRAVLPAGRDPRLTPSGAVSIDFHRSRSAPG